MKTVRSVLRVLADDIYSITCDMELQKMDSIVDESLLELQQVLVPEEIKITVMEKCSHEVCPICVDIERAEAWNACRQEVLRRMRGGGGMKSQLQKDENIVIIIGGLIYLAFLISVVILSGCQKPDGLYLNHKWSGEYSVVKFCQATERAGLFMGNKEVVSKGRE